jgi:hypothetical protein
MGFVAMRSLMDLPPPRPHPAPYQRRRQSPFGTWRHQSDPVTRPFLAPVATPNQRLKAVPHQFHPEAMSTCIEEYDKTALKRRN